VTKLRKQCLDKTVDSRDDTLVYAKNILDNYHFTVKTWRFSSVPNNQRFHFPLIPQAGNNAEGQYFLPCGHGAAYFSK